MVASFSQPSFPSLLLAQTQRCTRRRWMRSDAVGSCRRQRTAAACLLHDCAGISCLNVLRDMQCNSYTTFNAIHLRSSEVCVERCE